MSTDAPRNADEGSPWAAPGGASPRPGGVPAVPPVPAPAAPPAPPPGYGQPAPPAGVAPPAYPQPGGMPPAYPRQGPPQGPPPGWAPPPKPGLVPLRPLTLGDMLGAAFRVFRRNPLTTFGTALLFSLGSTVIVAGVGALIVVGAIGRYQSALPQDRDSILPGTIAGGALALLVPVFFQVGVQAILQGVLVLETSHQIVGEKMRLRGLLRQARGRIWALIGWAAAISGALLVGIGILAGVVVLLVVGVGQAAGITAGVLVGVFGSLGIVVLAVWVGTKTVLVPSVLLLERLAFRAAIARSWRLTRGSFWKTFGIIALVAVIVSVASNVASAPVSFIGGLAGGLLAPNGSDDSSGAVVSYVLIQVASGLVALVVGAIGSVIQSATVALIYVDLRIRREGLDLDLVRYVELRQHGVTPLPDPYRPPGSPTAPPGVA